MVSRQAALPLIIYHIIRIIVIYEKPLKSNPASQGAEPRIGLNSFYAPDNC